MNQTDRISFSIIVICFAAIIFVLWRFSPGEEIFVVISLIGSVASTGGLVIAIIQILELRKTAEATQLAINSTEKELSVMRSIESAAACFNQLNQIDEYLETNNFDSIKTLLPIATKNFHEMIFYENFSLEKLMETREPLEDFLEDFASQLTILINHRNIKKADVQINDEDLENISSGIQKVKAFSNKYKTKLQQEIII